MNSLYLALHRGGLFNNKTLSEQAPISKKWHIKLVEVNDVKELEKRLSSLPYNAMIVDSTPKELKSALSLSSEDWINETKWLIIDAEYSDTLPKEYKKSYDLQSYVKLLRTKLNYKGQLLITSSSRWELKGEYGWHVYIPLNDSIDRGLLKDFLCHKFRDFLAYGASSSPTAVIPQKYKRCEVLDTQIYTVARKIYEAKQLNSIDGRTKIIHSEMGDGSKLSVQAIKSSVSQAKLIDYKLYPETEQRLQEIEAYGVNKYGEKKYKRLLELHERGFLSPHKKLVVKGKGELTVKEVVAAGLNVQYRSDLDSGDVFKCDYYPNSGLFVDHHAGTKHRMDMFDALEEKDYVPENFYQNAGWYGADTGMGKTTAVKSYAIRVNKPVIIALPTKNQAEKVANDKDYKFVRALNDNGDTFKLEDLESTEVYTMTYAKLFAHIDMIVASDIEVFIDEAHNLLTQTYGNDEQLIKFLRLIDEGRFFGLSGTPLLQFVEMKDHVKKRNKPEIEIKIIRNAKWENLYKKHNFVMCFRGSKYSKASMLKDLEYLEKTKGKTQMICSDIKIKNELHNVNVISNTSGVEAIDVFYDEDVDIAVIAYDPNPLELVQWLGRIRSDCSFTVYLVTTEKKMCDKSTKTTLEASNADNKLLDYYLAKLEDMGLFSMLKNHLPNILKQLKQNSKYADEDKEPFVKRTLAIELMEKAKYSKGLFLNLVNQWGKFKIVEYEHNKRVKTLGKGNKLMASNWIELKYEVSCFGEENEILKAKAEKKIAKIESIAKLHNERVKDDFGDDYVDNDEMFDIYNTPEQFKLFEEHGKLLRNGGYDELLILLPNVKSNTSISNDKKKSEIAAKLRNKYKGLSPQLTHLELIKKFYQVDSENRRILSIYKYPKV